MAKTSRRREVQGELSEGKMNATFLENKLTIKEQRHTVELEHLKSSLMNARNEHLTSVTQRMETNFKEKVQFQVKAKQLENELIHKQQIIERLKKRVTI